MLYLPYLLGERSAPVDHDARGAFLGLRVGTTKGDLVRAVLEGVGYNLKIIRDILRRSAPMDSLTVIGGGAKGRTWLQILADIWEQELTLPRYREEATSMGARHLRRRGAAPVPGLFPWPNRSTPGRRPCGQSPKRPGL